MASWWRTGSWHWLNRLHLLILELRIPRCDKEKYDYGCKCMQMLCPLKSFQYVQSDVDQSISIWENLASRCKALGQRSGSEKAAKLLRSMLLHCQVHYPCRWSSLGQAWKPTVRYACERSMTCGWEIWMTHDITFQCWGIPINTISSHQVLKHNII